MSKIIDIMAYVGITDNRRFSWNLVILLYGLYFENVLVLILAVLSAHLYNGMTIFSEKYSVTKPSDLPSDRLKDLESKLDALTMVVGVTQMKRK